MDTPVFRLIWALAVPRRASAPGKHSLCSGPRLPSPFRCWPSIWSVLRPFDLGAHGSTWHGRRYACRCWCVAGLDCGRRWWCWGGLRPRWYAGLGYGCICCGGIRLYRHLRRHSMVCYYRDPLEQRKKGGEGCGGNQGWGWGRRDGCFRTSLVGSTSGQGWAWLSCSRNFGLIPLFWCVLLIFALKAHQGCSLVVRNFATMKYFDFLR